jgi:drug/metabolite transporter (DMT)-like permease
MLVAAVLGPEQREDRELEVVRLPAEQVADPLQLAVRQPEGAMKRLFRYRRQVIECSRLTGRVAPRSNSRERLASAQTRMSRNYVPHIAALAAIWGASYMFIKVADRAFEPATMMLFRLLIASALVFGVLAAQRGLGPALAEMRRFGWQGFLLGVVNCAVPFTLIAWGETHIDSGVAAIANSSMPIFVVLLAVGFQPSERVAGLRLGGFLLGTVGVGVLAGVHPRGGWWGVAGTLAVVVASLSYAIGSLWAQRLVARTSALPLATASMIGGAIVLVPPGLAQLPSHVPGWKETGSVLALAVLGTALAQIILYRVLRSDGAARVSLVTYLLPVTALFYGVTLLGEPLTLQELLGMVLILGGVALGSGALRLSRSRQPAAAPTP